MMMRRVRPSVGLAVTSALVMAVGMGLGYGVAHFVHSPAQELAETAAPPLGVRTAVVSVRQLVQKINADATASRSVSVSIPTPNPPDGSESVITSVGVKPGGTVRAGSVVAEVSGLPVIVLPGVLPSYRSLEPGDHGPDVAQLQRALESLGYRVDDAKGFYQSGTAAAVALLYRGRGYLPTVVGEEELHEAAQQLRDARAALRSATTDQRKELNVALASAQRGYQSAKQHSGASVPQGQVAFVSTLPASVSRVYGTVGSKAGGNLIALQSGPFVINANMNSLETSGLKIGASAQVLDMKNLKACSVATIGANSGETVKVGITCRHRVQASLTGQALRVTVTLAKTPTAVLSVPTSAIQMTLGGQTTVMVQADSGRRVVRVQTGFVGGGYTEVTPVGDNLQPGDRVVIGPTDD